MRKPFIAAAFLFFPSAVLAQSTSGPGDLMAKEVDDRWTLGLAASATDSPYAGEGTRIRPFPLITYDGERIFWRGLFGGVHAVKGDVFTLDVIVAGRFDGFDIKDLGPAELARNGVDASLLEDRDDGVDVGLGASWEWSGGEIKVRALTDVSDTSSGTEFSAEYSYPFHWGRTIVAPGVGASWMSKDLVNYYYGTLDEEVARGVPFYQPGSAVVPQLSVNVVRPLGDKWMLFGSVDYEFLPNEITDSPLIDSDASGKAGLKMGFSRRF